MLNIPAPRVYSWSSKADESAVGAEYIIMEKVRGVQLSSVWEDLHLLKKSKIVTQLAGFDKYLVSNPLPAYGSLYYSEDPSGHSKFTMGPTNNRRFFDDGRGSLDLDRGPCKSPRPEADTPN